MEITREGLILGAGTILTKVEGGAEGTSPLALPDEERIVALLTTAFERPIDIRVLAANGRACELWKEGEKALAHIHLAHADLPPCSDARALRPFAANALLPVRRRAARAARSTGL